jgi:predicted transcriptional regulator
MFSTIELLDLAKAKAGDVSDYRLAKMLGVDQTSMSNYRRGRSQPKNPIAMRLAELCDLDPAEVVAWVNLERSSTPEDAQVWQLLLSRIQRPKRAPAHA